MSDCEHEFFMVCGPNNEGIKTCRICGHQPPDQGLQMPVWDMLSATQASLREHMAIIKNLRRALDDIKIRAYELGNKEIHDMALAALREEE